jgi:archaellum component FlaC
MSEYRRNVIIGLTLLVGVAGLTWLVIMFGEAPAWLIGGKSYPIHVYFSNVENVITGDPVYMKGVRIGSIESIGLRNEQQPEEGVQVDLNIQAKWRIPRSARVSVEQSAIGFSRPLIKIIVPPQPATEFLPEDGSVPLYGEMVSAFESLIPHDVVAILQKASSQIGNLAEALTPVANDLHDLLQPRDLELVDHPQVGGKRLSANLRTAVDRLDSALKNFNEVIGDPNVKSNVRVAVQNIRDVSEQAKVVMEDLKKVVQQVRFVAEDAKTLTGKLSKTADTANTQLDKIARAIIDDAEKLGQVFDHLEVASRNMAEGKGSAGKFFGDAELYDSMVITMKRLQLTIEDMDNLVKQWQREGLSIKGVGLFK